jgi:hypothetical protein
VRGRSPSGLEFKRTDPNRVGELEIGAGILPPEPAARNRQVKAGPVFGRASADAQERVIVLEQCPKHHLAGLALSRGCFGVVPCLVGCLGSCNVSAGCGDQPELNRFLAVSLSCAEALL